MKKYLEYKLRRLFGFESGETKKIEYYLKSPEVELDSTMIQKIIGVILRIRHNFSFSTHSQFGEFRIQCSGLSTEEIHRLKEMGYFITEEVPNKDSITYHFNPTRAIPQPIEKTLSQKLFSRG